MSSDLLKNQGRKKRFEWLIHGEVLESKYPLNNQGSNWEFGFCSVNHDYI